MSGHYDGSTATAGEVLDLAHEAAGGLASLVGNLVGEGVRPGVAADAARILGMLYTLAGRLEDAEFTARFDLARTGR